MTEITMKTDIIRKLELVANLKPGQMWPEGELGPAMDWGTALSAICAEALAEIKFLKSEMVRHSQRRADLPDASKYWYTVEHLQNDLPPIAAKKANPIAPMSGDAAADAMSKALEPAPEPWGSPFAMNTENWA